MPKMKAAWGYMSGIFVPVYRLFLSSPRPYPIYPNEVCDNKSFCWYLFNTSKIALLHLFCLVFLLSY